MDAITVNLRVGRMPPASSAVGGELSAAELDANFTNLKTACEQLAVETKTITVGTGLGTTGTVNLDLAALTGTAQRITLTGNPTFTTSNRATNRHMELRLSLIHI